MICFNHIFVGVYNILNIIKSYIIYIYNQKLDDKQFFNMFIYVWQVFMGIYEV